MRKAFAIFYILIFFLAGSPALGNEALSKILEGIRNKYGHLPGLTITYTREVITRSMYMLGNQVKGDLARGQIYFKPPHFMRLEQKTPQAETIIANGDTIWWYIPEKKRAYQYCSKEFGKELSMLNDIFRGLSRVEDKFQISLMGKNKQGEYQIELRPNPPWEEIDHIVITVASGYDIRGVDSYSQLGSTTRFRLKGLTKKDNFEKDFFQFLVPEGVQVERGGG